MYQIIPHCKGFCDPSRFLRLPEIFSVMFSHPITFPAVSPACILFAVATFLSYISALFPLTLLLECSVCPVISWDLCSVYLK